MVTSLNRDYKCINQSSVQEMMHTVKARSELLTALSSGLQSSIILWMVRNVSKKRSTYLDCLNLDDNCAMFLQILGTTRPMTEHHIPKDLNPQINIFKFKVNFVTMTWRLYAFILK
jgi:hypothetical protein